MFTEKSYTNDESGDLQRIIDAVYVALSRYDSRENAPLWLRMIHSTLDFYQQKLTRGNIKYVPVERAVKSYARNGGN